MTETKDLTAIWDAGGVLYTFDQSITDRKLSQDSGRSLEEISAILFGGSAHGREYNQGLVEPYNLGNIDSLEFYKRLKKALGLKMDYSEFADAWSNIFTPNTEILEFIKRVHTAGYRQGILSSTNPLHWYGMRRIFDLESLLGRERIVCTFDLDAGEKKPHPKLFDLALRRTGGIKDRTKTAYLDDVLKYATAADNYGIKGIHVDNTKPDFQERCIEDAIRFGINTD